MFKKIRFYKRLLIEVIETLCTICLYLEKDSVRSHNPYGQFMRSHVTNLKDFSREIRGGGRSEPN